MTTTELSRNDGGQLIEFAWPGGYPVFYLCQDGGVLCPTCARMAEADRENHPADDPQWNIVASDINWEHPLLACDHCYKVIELAYGDSD